LISSRSQCHDGEGSAKSFDFAALLVELHEEVTVLGAGLTVSEAADGEWRVLDLTNVVQAVVDNRDNEFVNYQLYPSDNSLDPDDGTGAMASYIRSLMPTPTASLNTDGCLWGFNSSASGVFNWYSSLSFGSIFMRYRLPSGLVSEWTIPLYQPPHIPY
jgi:hypothetical protein